MLHEFTPKIARRDVHHPEKARRLVDGDRVAGVERAEEERLPALRSGLHRRRVVRVRPTRRAEAPEIEDRGGGEQREERGPLPCGRPLRSAHESAQAPRWTPARRRIVTRDEPAAGRAVDDLGCELVDDHRTEPRTRSRRARITKRRPANAAPAVTAATAAHNAPNAPDKRRYSNDRDARARDADQRRRVHDAAAEVVGEVLRACRRRARPGPRRARRSTPRGPSRQDQPSRCCTTCTRLSASSTQSTGTSWMRRPLCSASSSSSVSKNQPSSAIAGKEAAGHFRPHRLEAALRVAARSLRTPCAGSRCRSAR